MSKFFYRIEHRTKKIGPYNCTVKYEGCNCMFTSVLWDILGHAFNDSYHKSPRQDGLSQFHNERSRYGFASLTSLKKWFGQDEKTYKVFKRFGFVLRRYKVTTRFDSRRQSIAMLEELVDGVEIPFDRIVFGV